MNATEHYFEEQDTFSQWKDECCAFDTSGAYASAADLYQSWRRHTEDLGEDPGNSKMLGQKLKRIGLFSGQKRVRRRNCKVWFGISLRTTDVT